MAGAGRQVLFTGLPAPDVPARPSHVPGPSPRKRPDPVPVLKAAALADADGGPSPNSGMTTRELQDYWRNEKRCWKPVKLLFEIASASIEERKVSKFVVGGASA